MSDVHVIRRLGILLCGWDLIPLTPDKESEMEFCIDVIR